MKETPMEVATLAWRDASAESDGQTLFAIGDVHGCFAQFQLLLSEIARHAGECEQTHLVFLGDLVSKGPRSFDVLDLWASDEHEQRHVHVHRLYGNHEQMLMMIANARPNAVEAKKKFFSAGGGTVERELQHKLEDPSAAISRDLLQAATSQAVLSKLDRLQNHFTLGNLVFVHGGIDPTSGIAASLARPWTEISNDHWAWIQEPFLQHRDGYEGRLIIHGHTPPPAHREYTGYPDPHIFQHDRLCLDGGSSVSGIVVGAQIEDGRYRLIVAKE